jgi:hypothetical protein
VIGCKTSGYLLGTVVDGTYQPSPYMSVDDIGVLGRIKLGTDSVAGFRNILVSDCICENTRGLQMGAIDGGVLEDVTFSNILLRNPVNHPIFVRLSARNRAPEGNGPSQVRRVNFSNINVSGAPGPYASGVVGIPGGIIEDVSFSDIHVRSAGGGSREDAARDIEERPKSSLEPSFMKTFPAHGLWVRHARNVSIKDVSFSVDKADARPAVLLDDVQGATVDGLRSSLASERGGSRGPQPRGPRPRRRTPGLINKTRPGKGRTERRHETPIVPAAAALPGPGPGCLVARRGPGRRGDPAARRLALHPADAPGAQAAAFDDKAWTTVSTPHTYNIADSGIGGAKARGEPEGVYYRGPAWYRLSLDHKPRAGQRYFLQFDGAALKAEVFPERQAAGHARGRLRGLPL